MNVIGKKIWIRSSDGNAQSSFKSYSEKIQRCHFTSFARVVTFAYQILPSRPYSIKHKTTKVRPNYPRLRR